MKEKFTFKRVAIGFTFAILGVYVYCFIAPFLQPLAGQNYFEGVKSQLLDKGIGYTIVFFALLSLFWLYTKHK